MHIEEGVVTGAKLILGYATAATAGLYALRLAARPCARRAGSLAARGALATAATFVFFQVLPPRPWACPRCT